MMPFLAPWISSYSSSIPRLGAGPSLLPESYLTSRRIGGSHEFADGVEYNCSVKTSGR